MKKKEKIRKGEEMLNKSVKSNKAITLISLIVTVIVLLILAGITIVAITRR